MNPASTILRALIRGYQLLLSPVLPGACRYHPTCSSYALEAVTRFGALGGGWLAVKRFSRCHPLGGWGFDPVADGNPPKVPTGEQARERSP
ncbi:MAG: membrane protein insertion efficiency factor YidD [Rhodospirillales bacterium]